VVILGGGFGGLYAAQALANAPGIEITLIDRRNFHLFQPLLYQVATGSLSPGEIAAPLRSVLESARNCRVVLDEATGIDLANRRLLLASSDPIAYDSLIVATGSQTSYFGKDQWEEFAPGLKTIEEATRIRHRILFAFEAAERAPSASERTAWLTFVITGGGPTGVELAGAIAEISRQTLRHEFRNINPEESRILLLDGGERLLSAYPAELSAAAERSLIELGVRPRNRVRVIDVNDDGVRIRKADGAEEEIQTKTVIWAAGVRASGFGQVIADASGCALDKGGRVMVEPDLTVPGHPEIFVLGDLAHFGHGVAQPLPGVAPVAMQQAQYAARLIRARNHGGALPPFRYFDRGSLAVIGRRRAVAYFEKFGKFKFSGFFAWVLWLFIHLMYIVEFESRLLVFIRWGLQFLTFHRGARLITGPLLGAERKR
jgi:NADH dehydrogenase